ncbi:MAG: NAD(P)/FAD-dependent oxidoreductase [Candidatus Sericytochromatia bacterium]
MGQDFDVIVIGGGPAGLMACVGAVWAGARVCLVEKGDRLGRKLIISGGGRCNVTNNKEIQALVREIPGNGKFMYTAFHQFGPPQIIRFFTGLGIALKEEDNGRMFPVTDKATTVAEALIGYIRDRGVTFRLGTPVERVLYEDGRVAGVKLVGKETLRAPAVVLAVGGMSVPKTGSTGDGYAWAKEAGHTLTRLFPTEAPVHVAAPWIQARTLMGLSLKDVALTLVSAKGKKLTTQTGDMIFTHFGVSGPAALRLAHYVNTAMHQDPEGPLTLQLDARPGPNQEEVFQELWALAQAEPKKAVKNVYKGLVPERLLLFLLAEAGIDADLPAAHLPKGQATAFARLLKALPMRVTGTSSIEEAFVTGGGVSTKEIDPKTMGSKLMPGLFFAGEIMDVHAHTGGYNITIALSSGQVAGTAAGFESQVPSPKSQVGR